MRFCWIHTAVSLVALFASTSRAQDPLPIARASSPIRLDGRIDEEAWRTVTPLPLTMFIPTAGLAPTERSEIRLAFDDRYLYASGRFFVDRAADIRANSLYRDRTGNDDLFRLLLDTYNDAETAVVFATNPNGVRVDFAVQGDGQGMNQSWNALWDVATTRDDSSWTAEMRIPFSTLRFQEREAGVVMGLIVSRVSQNRNEVTTFPALEPRFANALTRPSVAKKIVLDGARSRPLVAVTPYALTGTTRSTALDRSGAEFVGNDNATTQVGGDVKIGLRSNVVVDLTANTDFAQVEVDDEQVNLTQFSLFFPEKRQFFQERSGVFEMNTGGFGDPSRLFHSRRIGLTDAGQPLRIYGGARLVGRMGAWDVAALDMQTAPHDSVSSENHGVLRMRRQLINPQSYIGGIATTRLGSDGSDNIAYGVDGQLRISANDFVSLQWAQTFDQQRAEQGIESGMVRALIERRAAQGLVFRADAKWSGPEFQPRLGFAPRRDFVALGMNVRYGWYPGTRTIFRSIQPSVLRTVFLRNRAPVVNAAVPGARVDAANNQGRSIESATYNNYLNYELKAGFAGALFVGTTIEDLIYPLRLPSATIPAARHRFTSASFSVFPPSGLPIRAGLAVGAGKFYDGRQFSLSIVPTWNVSPHLELGAEYQAFRARFASRGERLNADIARLRVQTAWDTRLSANFYVQYSHAADATVVNARVRYNFGEGRDLWLVVNDRLNSDRERLMPTLPELPISQERTVTVKYAYTFLR